MPQREQEGTRWVFASGIAAGFAVACYGLALCQSAPWSIVSRVQVDLGQRRAPTRHEAPSLDFSKQELWAAIPAPTLEVGE